MSEFEGSNQLKKGFQSGTWFSYRSSVAILAHVILLPVTNVMMMMVMMIIMMVMVIIMMVMMMMVMMIIMMVMMIIMMVMKVALTNAGFRNSRFEPKCK